MIEAEILVSSDMADILYDSLKPEEGSHGERSEVKVYLQEDTVRIKVRAADVVSARAALNTWLRLVNVVLETGEVLK